MPRVVKTINLENGEEVEVYVDSCNVCSREMIFPKKRADELESLMPFLKNKVEQGTPCVDCSKKLIEEGTFKLFSDEEIEEVKRVLLHKQQ